MANEIAGTLKMGPCPSCEWTNLPDARFCGGCGAHLLTGAAVGDGTAAIADPLIGRVIADRYKIVSLLGRGGMGVVYKCEHVHIGKLIAMKLLHGELANDRETQKRFRWEAEAVSRLSHVNTVQIFDFGRSEGMMYLSMEYIEGRDFGHIVHHEGPLHLIRVARICAQVCSSVGEAHALGIVHRDLKPENIMIVTTPTEPDFVKVLDFGLAKLRDPADASHVTLTRTGSIVGTPYYMSPEQIRGETVDARGDVYAIGAMMYKACAGVPPFWAPTPMGVLSKHLTEDVVPPSERSSRRDLPADLDRIVIRCMQKEPEDRYPSADALRQDLVAYLASVGQVVSESAIRLASLRPVASDVLNESGRRVSVPVATRHDVDKYESRLRRWGYIGYLFLAVFLGSLATAGVLLWRKQPPPPPAAAEQEPNNSPSQANELPPSRRIEGFLGKRMSDSQSDADVYAIRGTKGTRRVARFELTRVPNMNVVLEIVRAGSKTPSVIANSGGTGEPEIIPNFPLKAPLYYARVRELWDPDRPPTENVSDSYSILWREVPAGADEEREINDSFEAAEWIGVSGKKRGYVSWASDIDTYCFEQDAREVAVRLDGVRNLDLILTVVNRNELAEQRANEAGLGAGETVSIEMARARTTCLRISADPYTPRAKWSNADQPYTLEWSSRSGS